MKIYDYKGRKNLCGNRVKEARARLNITQTDLAARLQVAGITMERDSVSRIEIGTRFVTDYELVVLAKVLGVSPSSAYELMHEEVFPSVRIGSRFVVPKDKFQQWVERQTGGAR